MSPQFHSRTFLCMTALTMIGCIQARPPLDEPTPKTWPESGDSYVYGSSPTEMVSGTPNGSPGATPTRDHNNPTFSTAPTPSYSPTPSHSPMPSHSPTPTRTADGDGDGMYASEGDCNPEDPQIFLGAPDLPFDGVDSNCNGIQDFIVTVGGLRLGDGGDVTRARFAWPQDIALTSTTYGHSDSIYVSDRDLCRVRVLDDGRVSTIAGDGNCASSEDGGQGASSSIMPGDIAYDLQNDRVYIAEPALHRIRYIDLTTGKIHTLIGSGTKGDPDENSPINDVNVCAPANLTMSTNFGYNLYFTSGGSSEPSCAPGIWRLRVHEPTGDDLFRLAGGSRCLPMEEGKSRESSVCPTGLRAFYSSRVRLAVIDEGLGGGGALFQIDSPTQSNPDVIHLAGGETTTCGAFDGGVDAASAGLCFPSSPGVTVDKEIILPQQGTLVFYDPSTDSLSHLGGEGAGNPPTGETGDALAIGMGNLGPAIVDAYTNKVYFLEPELSIVRSLSMNGNSLVDHIAGHSGSGYEEGTVLDSVFSKPAGIAIQFEPEEIIYVADRGNSVVRIIRGGETQKIIGIPGQGGYEGDGASGQLAKLDDPQDVAIAPNGDLFILTNNRVRRLRDGIISTVAGTGEAGFNGDDIPGEEAQLNGPLDIAIGDGGQSLYIADTGNFRIRRLDLSVEPPSIHTVVGTGDEGQLQNGSAALETTMGRPIALSFQGNTLYFSQDASWVIAKLNDGKVQVLGAALGDYGAGVTDIVPIEAQVQSLLVDEFGILFFGGEDNILYRIGDGWPLAILGNETQWHYNKDQGTLPDININITTGTGLALSESGSVYLSDEIHHVIRALTF